MSNPKNLYILGSSRSKKISIKFLHWHRGTPKAPENFIVSTLLDFQNRFSPEILAGVFFFKVSVQSFIYFCWFIRLRIIVFHPCSGILVDQKCQKVMLVLTCLDNQTHVSSTLPLHFSFKVSMGRFLLEAGCLFLNVMEFVLCIGIGVLIDQKFC